MNLVKSYQLIFTINIIFMMPVCSSWDIKLVDYKITSKPAHYATDNSSFANFITYLVNENKLNSGQYTLPTDVSFDPDARGLYNFVKKYSSDDGLLKEAKNYYNTVIVINKKKIDEIDNKHLNEMLNYLNGKTGRDLNGKTGRDKAPFYIMEWIVSFWRDKFKG